MERNDELEVIYNSFLFLPELGSDEESGKDWSDLEREAAEEDKIKQYDDMKGGPTPKSSSSSRHHR